MIHFYPEDFIFEEPQEFTDPFRYVPHPLVRFAASEVIARIDADPNLRVAFSEGKMLGVLVCSATISDDKHDGSQSRSMGVCSTRPSCLSSTAKGTICYIAAFSGTIDGRSQIDGFVPPIYDLTIPDGYFKMREAEISAINLRIEQILKSQELSALRQALTDAGQDRDRQFSLMRASMKAAKKKREETRSLCTDPSVVERLVKESQFEKAEARRLKLSWKACIGQIQSQIDGLLEEVEALKKERASMSDRLQDWIFRQYIVHNALGEEASIADIFSESALTPPGGTGECAAPKLLEYAFRHGLRPLAMGEFWYGKSPDTAVRSHGKFYPSCTSKCGPLLKFMLKGSSRSNSTAEFSPARKFVIVYEDDSVIVVEKPSGMPSVPGLDGKESLLEQLSAISDKRTESKHLYPVHRLDMDTSGIMVFAKTPEAAVNLRKQFEEHSVRKTYMARVCSGEIPEGAPKEIHLVTNAGHIDLPLSADYDERPRQKVDFKQGKPAHTEYQVVKEHHDGTADLLLYPYTGRTHQLRVHCAHHLGLGRPIVGDFLYGGHHTLIPDESHTPHEPRLHLHALSISFRHPVTSELLTFSSQLLKYHSV